MRVSDKGIKLIQKWEGYKGAAYLCPAGIPTIGWGSTMYQDGSKVKIGDKITQDKAYGLLLWECDKKVAYIRGLLKVTLTQNQLDAIVSFCYNLGVGAFEKSTLLKKINLNPNDTTIRNEFMKWNKARVKGVLTELKGLTERRKEEADLYFTK